MGGWQNRYILTSSRATLGPGVQNGERRMPVQPRTIESIVFQDGYLLLSIQYAYWDDFDVSKVIRIYPTKRAPAFRHWMKKLMSSNRKWLLRDPNDGSKGKHPMNSICNTYARLVELHLTLFSGRDAFRALI
jgi:hypothetical protein